MLPDSRCDYRHFFCRMGLVPQKAQFMRHTALHHCDSCYLDTVSTTTECVRRATVGTRIEQSEHGGAHRHQRIIERRALTSLSGPTFGASAGTGGTSPPGTRTKRILTSGSGAAIIYLRPRKWLVHRIASAPSPSSSLRSGPLPCGISLPGRSSAHGLRVN